MIVIYTPASKAEIRRNIITDDARTANFLPESMEYDPVIFHPTEDKAALPIVNMEHVRIALGVYTEAVNFSIFFTENERAGAVETLPADWNQEN